MALATTADWTAITGEEVSDAEETRVERLLEVASAVVLASANGQLVESGTTTAILRPSVGGVIRLPQRPIRDVTAVAYLGATLTAAQYRWTDGLDGTQGYLVRVVDGVDSHWAGEVTVTYDHGWEDIPEPIVAATVLLAQQIKGSPGGRTVQSESIDDYTVRFLDDGGLPGWMQSAIDSLTLVPEATSITAVREW